jgi:hypothetical protein
LFLIHTFTYTQTWTDLEKYHQGTTANIKLVPIQTNNNGNAKNQKKKKYKQTSNNGEKERSNNREIESSKQ